MSTYVSCVLIQQTVFVYGLGHSSGPYQTEDQSQQIQTKIQINALDFSATDCTAEKSTDERCLYHVWSYCELQKDLMSDLRDLIMSK